MSKLIKDKSQYSKQTDRKKIMLTDLCPQQKAKVGQLMMLMQKQKTNAQNLSKLLKIQEQNHRRIAQQNNHRNRIRNQNNNQLYQVIFQEKITVNLKNIQPKPHKDFSIQTNVQNVHESTQTKIKKNKNKNVQTNCQPNTDANKTNQKDIKDIENFEYTNTAQKNHKQNTEKSDALNYIMEQLSYKKNYPPLPTKNSIRKDQAMTYDQLNQKNSQDQNQASQMAYAWLQLKKKNIHKIKKDIQKSKKKIQKTDRDVQQDYSSDSQSQQKFMEFYKKLRVKPKQESRIMQMKLQSSKGSSKGSKYNNKQEINLDEQQLNQLLKSGDFRASKVIGKGFSGQNTKRSKKMGFYEQDLLDLIEQIQK